MTDAETELRNEFREALSDVDFPVQSQFEVVPALPNGAKTTFEADGVSLTVATLATKLGPYQDFPYETIDDLADDVITGMKAEDII